MVRAYLPQALKSHVEVNTNNPPQGKLGGTIIVPGFNVLTEDNFKVLTEDGFEVLLEDSP